MARITVLCGSLWPEEPRLRLLPSFFVLLRRAVVN